MTWSSPVTTVEYSDLSQLHDLGFGNIKDTAHLPDFSPVVSPDFHCSSLDSATFSQVLDLAYREVVHWKKNCFDVLCGLVGKQFVSELARLFCAVGKGYALEFVAIFVACVLLLQKQSRTS